MSVAAVEVQDLRVEVSNKVATLTMNRPEKLNALSGDMISSAISHLREFAVDPQIGAVVVTGEGRAFCAGGDVSGMSNRQKGGPAPGLEERLDGLRAGQEFSYLLYTMPKLTIAAVNGFAMGAGLGIAMSCDLRIVSDKAKFGTAYAKVGLGGDYGVSWQLARLVGQAKAKELFILGDIIDAEEARRVGLANRIYPHDTLMDEVGRIAGEVANGPLVSFRYMKENVNLAMVSDFRTILEREAMTHTRCGGTDDHREGVAAFMEKRKADFKGL